MILPAAAKPMVEFPQLLRNYRFSVSPDQTMDFLRAIIALGPDSIMDIRNAGMAVFAIPPERRAEYDALFRGFFLEETVPIVSEDDSESEETEAHDMAENEEDVRIGDEEESGLEASQGETLTATELQRNDDDNLLADFARKLRSALPLRNTYRLKPANRGKQPDMRRSLRESIRRDGEVFTLFARQRKSRQRPQVLVLDISGSMRDQNDEMMRFAHAFYHAAERLEVFTLGTRLTRITAALAPADPSEALVAVERLVADFEGGTRIGDTLAALLAVPKFTSTLRGSVVTIVSDGLERDDPSVMVEAVRRLSRTAWRLDWLTPLADSTAYVPTTQAMIACKPWLNSLGAGRDIKDLCTHFLTVDYSDRRLAA